MALTGKTNEEKIWNYLYEKIKNPFGVAGLMGNMMAESGLQPNNLQNTYEKSLGFTDEEYTKAVDNGSYTNFVNDKAGYGLVQFTFWSLKEYVLNYAKKKGASIGDLEMQLECVCTLFKEQYSAVWSALTNATNVLDASNAVLLKFERPADQSATAQNKRASYGQTFYDKYAKSQQGSDTGYSYSVGDTVNYDGTIHYKSSDATTGSECKPGEAKVTAIAKNAKHPYHLIRVNGKGSTVYGWVDANLITPLQGTNKEETTPKTGGTTMKYNSSNKPMQCMMTQSTCYKGTSKMTVKGILWHSTGANNPNIKRYVQPDDNASNRAELLAKIGKNAYGNDWNHIYHEAGLNCWVGKLADGTVTTVQTMPWDYRPWGCGSGSKGSCNNGWIQFEICEDALTDKNYFEKAYKEACEITAYLCQMFNIDPNGTVNYNGIKVPTILCHADSHNLGLGSNHGDIYNWFPKFGKNMETARADVTALLKSAGGGSSSGGGNSGGSNSGSETSSALKYATGDIVDFTGTTHYTSSTGSNGSSCKPGVAKVTAIAKGAKHPYHLIRENNGGSTVYGWVDENTISGKHSTSTGGGTSTPSTPTSIVAGTKLTLQNVPLYASSTTKTVANKKTGTYYAWSKDVISGRIRITNSTANVGKSGQVTGWISYEDAKKAAGITTSSSSSGGTSGGITSFTPYLVKVTTDNLNIRKGAGTNYAVVGAIKDKGVYTIVAEASGTGATKWGKLKSGAGYISLDYCKRV